jgi:membrane-associated protein
MEIISNLVSFLHLLKDPINLIKTVGIIGMCLIIFAETGLLFGFFLPGDSLLIAAGILASDHHLPLDVLLVSLSISAIVGDAVGFYIGHKLGDVLYSRPESFFFRKKHLEMAQDFYIKHGGKTILFARFIPIVRTFAPTVAGAAQMNYFKFASYNIIGGLVWIFSLVLSGYYLGKLFGDKIQDEIHIVIFIVIFLSILPLIIKWYRMRRKKSYVS